MTVDPAGAGAFAKFFDTLKNWPLWLLVGIALCLTVLVAIPAFHAIVPPRFAAWVLFATLAAWILAAARTVSLLPDLLAARRAARTAATKFVITPIESQSFWHLAKQTDGSYITQFAIRCMVKNRMSEPLHLMKARILRPKISGDELPGIVTMRAPDNRMHGTAFGSGFHIPPGMALPASADLFVRGMPKQRSGPMKVLVEFKDADANASRATMLLSFTSPPGPEYIGPIKRLIGRFS